MKRCTVIGICLLWSAAVGAQETGPVIESAGPSWEVEAPGFATPLDLDYKVVFEAVSAPDDATRPNGTLVTVARFLNMHARAGVPREQVKAAVVVHGGAAWGLLNADAYGERNDGATNPNTELIRELTEAGVQVILCGQTAGARGISTDMLLPDVKVALSAMTALYVLQTEGYRHNPW